MNFRGFKKERQLERKLSMYLLLVLKMGKRRVFSIERLGYFGL